MNIPTEYYFYFNTFAGVLILLYSEIYGAVLIIVLFLGFSFIVLSNKKYKYMVNYIEKFF